MSFDHPWALWGFVIILPFIVYDLFSIPRRRDGMPPVLGRRLLISTTLFGLFLVFFVIALSGPQWGNSPARSGGVSASLRRDLDVVLALDVSGSMDIRDVPDNEQGAISRLERGLSIAFATVTTLPDPRYAAASGRGRGILAVPLTWDNDAVLNFLEAVDGGALTGRGTNLESLLDAAAGAFQDSFPARRIILLVSDGETLSGSLQAAVNRLNQNNISVCALALGSDDGRPVAGQPDAISRRDVQAMLTAAERTNGIYIDGNRDDAPAVLAEYLRSIAPRADSGGTGEKKRWFIFLIAAIICYGLSKLSLLKKRK